MNEKFSPPPFAEDYRASGLLMHVTSLPSRYGIGDFGPPALAWIDRLHEAGQSWWQMLPLGPTGYGNSPYQPLSSFALNELLISPDWLIEDELLRPSDLIYAAFPSNQVDPNQVDYERVTPFKQQLLKMAWTRFSLIRRSGLRSAFDQFCVDQAHWLNEYALFRALKEKFNGAYYLEWPKELIERDPAAIKEARRELADRIESTCFTQFVAYRQAGRMKAHAQGKGVKLIGDLPFFVSPDSSDVWATPELFLLDEHRRPQFVAGVPPDYFSSTGQLWGNPVYNWDALRNAGYKWGIDRLRALLSNVDVVRLDHFRGFGAAWHVPMGAQTAESGSWRPGPGAEFFAAVKRELDSLPFIAEDLGQITPDVYALRDQFQLPGMRILQFAFDGHADNPHLPENYVANTVVYSGTHDNKTSRSWYDDMPPDQRRNLWQHLQRPAANTSDAAWTLLDMAWSSRAARAIAPVQDVLNLGSEARMNVPGRPGGNWRWRCTEDMLSGRTFERIRKLTETSKRLAFGASLTDDEVREVVIG